VARTAFMELAACGHQKMAGIMPVAPKSSEQAEKKMQRR